MTRDEAIESLQSIIDTYKILEGNQVNSDVPIDKEDIQALESAIKAIKFEQNIIKYAERLCEENISNGMAYIKVGNVFQAEKEASEEHKEGARRNEIISHRTVL